MKYDPEKHHRRSIRLKGYDYRQAGAYFVTIIVTQGRECLFGEVVDGAMRVNEFGRIVQAEWLRTAEMRPRVIIDPYVIIPNHIHGIIVLTDGGRGTLQRAPTNQRDPTNEQFGKPASDSVPTIVRLFKSATTRRINEHRDTPGVSVWQRNYYEHIIRNEESLNHIREYIANNPLQWELDWENPNVGARCNVPLPKDESWGI